MRRLPEILCLLAMAVAAPACHAADPQVRSVIVTGNRAITLVVSGLDARDCCGDTAAFRVSAVRRARSAPVRIARVGTDAQLDALDAMPSAAVIETRVHLLLDRPLEPGRRYRLSAGSPALATDVVFDPDARSPAIRVNQLGYVPGARKLAIVGAWLGTAGPMPIDSAQFAVVDAEGTTVLQGPLELRAAADPWSGEDVYVADFSALSQAGRYRVRVPGLGTSDEFHVGDDVYEEAYRKVLRVLYHQRNSTPIEASFAAPGYARSGGVPAVLDAVIDRHAAPAPFGDQSGTGRRRTSRAGWFDAGDYGQYVPNASPVWFYAGLGMDLAPANFRDGDLGIPESGNGIPDILDELEWGFDWMLSMQDARDGGVYFRVASEQWDDGLPQQVRQPRLIAEKTTHATASFAAAAAIHARLLKGFRPDHAARAIAAAEAAWSFVREVPQWPAEGARYRNRPGMHAGEYSDTSALDNELWAAAEMLRTTGKKAYLDFFESNFQAVKLDPTGDVSYSSQEMAALWAYLQSDNARRDPAIVDAARRAVIAGADWRIRQMQSNPWLAPTHPRRSLLGWGSFAHSSRAALSLLQAYRLTGKQRYLEYAWLTPGPQLGINPQGLTYITGLGARSPRHPLSKLSQHSGAADPLPGLPVHGPHARLPGTWSTTRAVTAAYWPPAVDDGAAGDGGDGYPVLRRYTDSDQLPPMSEPTVAEVARDGVAYGLLRNGAALAATPAQQ